MNIEGKVDAIEFPFTHSCTDLRSFTYAFEIFSKLLNLSLNADAFRSFINIFFFFSIFNAFRHESTRLQKKKNSERPTNAMINQQTRYSRLIVSRAEATKCKRDGSSSLLNNVVKSFQISYFAVRNSFIVLITRQGSFHEFTRVFLHPHYARVIS